MDNCIFCKIAKGEIPCIKVYEDNDYIGFLDIKPLTKGHTLIIPKKHFRWVYDVGDQGGYWKAAQTVAQRLVQKKMAEYVMFVTWGEEVHHSHIHVIPRYEGDGHTKFLEWKNAKELSKEEMKEIGEKLRM